MIIYELITGQHNTCFVYNWFTFSKDLLREYIQLRRVDWTISLEDGYILRRGVILKTNNDT